MIDLDISELSYRFKTQYVEFEIPDTVRLNVESMATL